MNGGGYDASPSGRVLQSIVGSAGLDYGLDAQGSATHISHPMLSYFHILASISSQNYADFKYFDGSLRAHYHH